MESQTTGAGTKDWLEATKGMTILAYIEPDILGRMGEEHPLTKEGFEHVLRKVSRPIEKKSESQPGEGKSET